MLKDRFQFGPLMELMHAEIIIEIGVQEGQFAERILSNWPSFKQYYGIDPWIKQINYKDGANVEDNQQENKYQNTKNRLSKFGDRIKLIRKFSTDAHSLFADESIDFIYLDGRHDYCGVYEDLKLFYSKLKCNGVMAGHDYLTVNEVMKANGEDWGLCGNGTHVLVNGGSVKGKINLKIILIFIYHKIL